MDTMARGHLHLGKTGRSAPLYTNVRVEFVRFHGSALIDAGGGVEGCPGSTCAS